MNTELPFERGDTYFGGAGSFLDDLESTFQFYDEVKHLVGRTYTVEGTHGPTDTELIILQSSPRVQHFARYGVQAWNTLGGWPDPEIYGAFDLCDPGEAGWILDDAYPTGYQPPRHDLFYAVTRGVVYATFSSNGTYVNGTPVRFMAFGQADAWSAGSHCLGRVHGTQVVSSGSNEILINVGHPNGIGSAEVPNP